MKNDISILITGASGFIGSFLVEKGIERGYNTWAGIRATSSKKYLKDERICFIELDFTRKDKLKEQLIRYQEENGKWDCIIHCAGVTKCRDKAEFERANYRYTKNFIEALRETEMIPKQFLYVSTLGIFGPIREDTYLPIKESDSPCPNTAYGKSKLKAERYIESLPDFPYVFFRPTGVYGPREKDYFLMAKSIKNHIDLAAGFKRQDLTFIYVKDLVKAVYLAIDKQITRRAYFVSDGKVYTSLAFSDYIRKELGNPLVIRVKCPLFILKVISLLAESAASWLGKSSTLNGDKYKIMKQRNWQCDISPLVEELEYKPDYDLQEGVKEMIAWYKNEGWL